MGKNTELLLRWFDEAMLQGRSELVDELFTDKIIVHSYTYRIENSGIAEEWHCHF